ncbi:MAG TPA: CPBP family intramembrane glutamic endopeptidase [Gemmatimonadales bacterium]|nr:CPBP family intramembrane glutamic endopeptidase [Gemmatimonadales bacterium]
MRNLARRHPIALYLTIVFGLGVPLMMLGVLASRGILPGASLPARIGLDLERASALAMVLLALFPAAVIVTALDGGRPAVNAFFKRIVDWRIGAGWWAFILLALPATTVILALIFGDTFNPPTLGELVKEVGGFFFGFLLVNWWEESSWAGFMQTRLEQRHNLFVSAALTAVPFAGIHMPLQLLNGTPSVVQFFSNFLLLCVLAIVVRTYLGLIKRGTGESLLAVGVAHTIFNRSNNTDGIAALLLEGNHRQGAALLATFLVTIVLAIRYYRGLRRK